MTIGRVTKKDSRLFSKTYKFMKKNTNNLTLKDFAELIEFMNEGDNTSQPNGSQASRPILGLGNYLGSTPPLNNQVPTDGTQRQRIVINTRNDLSPSVELEKKKQNDADRNPLESTESRHATDLR